MLADEGMDSDPVNWNKLEKNTKSDTSNTRTGLRSSSDTTGLTVQRSTNTLKCIIRFTLEVKIPAFSKAVHTNTRVFRFDHFQNMKQLMKTFIQNQRNLQLPELHLGF